MLFPDPEPRRLQASFLRSRGAFVQTRPRGLAPRARPSGAGLATPHLTLIEGSSGYAAPPAADLRTLPLAAK